MDNEITWLKCFIQKMILVLCLLKLYYVFPFLEMVPLGEILTTVVEIHHGILYSAQKLQNLVSKANFIHAKSTLKNLSRKEILQISSQTGDIHCSNTGLVSHGRHVIELLFVNVTALCKSKTEIFFLSSLVPLIHLHIFHHW